MDLISNISIGYHVSPRLKLFIEYGFGNYYVIPRNHLIYETRSDAYSNSGFIFSPEKEFKCNSFSLGTYYSFNFNQRRFFPFISGSIGIYSFDYGYQLEIYKPDKWVYGTDRYNNPGYNWSARQYSIEISAKEKVLGGNIAAGLDIWLFNNVALRLGFERDIVGNLNKEPQKYLVDESQPDSKQYHFTNGEIDMSNWAVRLGFVINAKYSTPK